MLPLAVRMVYQVYEAVSIPIVGMGGVTTAEDVIELMLAGAAAVGVGAANLVEPYACKTIIENLPAVMERYGMENLTEIIGGAPVSYTHLAMVSRFVRLTFFTLASAMRSTPFFMP